MAEYKKLNEALWANFGKNLLHEKGSRYQEEFLIICKSGKKDFSKYIDDHLLSITDILVDGSQFGFEYKFCEAEFRYPPEDTQKIIWEKFKPLPSEVKASCGFWGYIIINMIKGGYIEPEYLASDLTSTCKTGVYIIDKALNNQDSDAKSKEIDNCVRRILRSMCNPEPRGKRIVFNDFYLGKSYWRWRWSYKMSMIIGLEFDQILEILNEGYYAEFAAKMHAGKSYIGSKNVLGGLLLFLQQSDSSKFNQIKLRKLIDKISYLSAWKAIEIQEPTLNKIEIEGIAETCD